MLSQTYVEISHALSETCMFLIKNVTTLKGLLASFSKSRSTLTWGFLLFHNRVMFIVVNTFSNLLSVIDT